MMVRPMDLFDAVGCFALTELGYGNNAVEMETTAHYDAKTQVRKDTHTHTQMHTCTHARARVRCIES